MDTKYFRAALAELGYKTGISLTTERLSQVLGRAQQLKETAAKEPTSEYFSVPERVIGTHGAKSPPEASTIRQVAG